jgi:exonuclease III
MDELSDASVHRSLSEVSPVLDDPKYNKQVILGGDLNTGTQWPKGDVFNKRDRNLLDRFEALGLVDCLKQTRASGRLANCPCVDDDCTHVRTRRDHRHPTVPYQTDYLFASERLASGLVSCEALASDEWFSVSDHAPIVAVFEL